MSTPQPITALIPTAISAITQEPTTASEVMPLRQGLIVNSSRLFERYFQNFQTQENESLTLALNEAMQFCLSMASPHRSPYWLTLLGRSGVGKTMLARAITQFFNRRLECLRDENLTGLRYRRGGLKSWGIAVNDMVEGDFTGLRDLKDDWFVCLDDIGAEYERHRDLSVAKLYDVLNARQGKFTVITANLTLEAVSKKMDARIASRLLRHGSVVVDIDAPDFNL